MSTNSTSGDIRRMQLSATLGSLLSLEFLSFKIIFHGETYIYCAMNFNCSISVSILYTFKKIDDIILSLLSI